MFINGKWVGSLSGESFEDRNPYTGELYAMVAKGDARDADRAMAAAFEARKVWAGTPPIERSKILFKAARNLEEKMMEVAAILQDEGGGTFGKAMFEISQTIDLIETAAADCKRILGETFHTDPTKLNMTLLRPGEPL
jgi:aldehyde dehydrogenase (NAD+)